MPEVNVTKMIEEISAPLESKVKELNVKIKERESRLKELDSLVQIKSEHTARELSEAQHIFEKAKKELGERTAALIAECASLEQRKSALVESLQGETQKKKIELEAGVTKARAELNGILNNIMLNKERLSEARRAIENLKAEIARL